MRTIEEHRKEIAALVEAALASRGEHEVILSEGLPGRAVLARDVVSEIDLPPFDNSQMDGYAVASADLEGDAASLGVAARIPAGHSPEPLLRGTAAPIMTGAPIPEGADAVVQIERADPAHFLPEDGHARVTLPAVAASTFVRRRGSDLRAGEVLFRAGTRLGAAQWGSLVAAGVEAVWVVDRPRILLLSTGEELAPAGRPLEPGKIYDANGASMSAALAEAGAEVVLARVTDDPDALLDVVRGNAGVDLVVSTGGVSEGAYEVVRETFGPRGVTFGSVAMQPGGPQGWGLLDAFDDSRPAKGPGPAVVAFPGNPVSALISFEVFLREPLLRASGRQSHRVVATAAMAEAADSPPGKHQIRRGRLDTDGLVHFVGGPSSHLLHAYATATHLVHVPLGVARVEPGDEVVVWALDD